MSRAFEREWNILIFRCANKDRLAKHILNEKKKLHLAIFENTQKLQYILKFITMATNFGECMLVMGGVGQRWFSIVILSLL